VTVLTGPVFDDQTDWLWTRGRADMQGFKAPRKYWKLVMRVDNGRLQATALVADQSPLVDYLPEMLDVGGEEAQRIAFDKVAKYQVSIPELERLTDLDFGNKVRTADTFVAPGPGSNENRVEKIEDVSLGRRGGRARKHARRRASGRSKRPSRSR
jgi:endonuclease G